MQPFEAIVIQRLNDAGSPSNTMVVKIPPTIAEHNVFVELLKRIRHEYPGAWYCAQLWEKEHFPGPITVNEAASKWPCVMPKEGIPDKAETIIEGIKKISREDYGLPPDDPIEDVKV